MRSAQCPRACWLRRANNGRSHATRGTQRRGGAYSAPTMELASRGRRSGTPVSKVPTPPAEVDMLRFKGPGAAPRGGSSAVRSSGGTEGDEAKNWPACVADGVNAGLSCSDNEEVERCGSLVSPAAGGCGGGVFVVMMSTIFTARYTGSPEDPPLRFLPCRGVKRRGEGPETREHPMEAAAAFGERVQ